MKSVNGERDAWTSQTVLKADKRTYETCLLIHNFVVLYTSFVFFIGGSVCQLSNFRFGSLLFNMMSHVEDAVGC